MKTNSGFLHDPLVTQFSAGFPATSNSRRSVAVTILAQSPVLVAFLSALGKLTSTDISLVPLDAAVCQRFGVQTGNRRRDIVSLTKRCPVALTEIRVPVMVDGQPQAVLTCSQFFGGEFTRMRFRRTVQELRRARMAASSACIKKSGLGTTAISSTRQKTLRQLLEILARHIGLLAEHWRVAPRDGEPSCVTCAKTLIQTHPAEMVRTRDAAHAAHVTEQYFCRVFKVVTGTTFSEYVARFRVELAKQLLADPRLRVTEAAAAAGFQSIPHFNHTFKRYTGVNPKTYRLALRRELVLGAG